MMPGIVSVAETPPSISSAVLFAPITATGGSQLSIVAVPPPMSSVAWK